MMNKILSVGSIGLALAAAPALSVALADEGAARRPRAERRFEELADYLGLSEQQRATWRSLHEEHRAEMQPLREEGRELRQRLREAMEAEKPDPQAIGVATLALKEHRAKMKAARETFQGRLGSVLTPEQKEKLEAFKAARRFDRRGRGGPGGRRGQRGQEG